MKQRTILLAILFASLHTFAQMTAEYEYDANNRLKKVTYSSGAVVTYTYDKLGNRLSKKVTGADTDMNANIMFCDPVVKQICIDNWDTNGDGELSLFEAAAVTDLGEVFQGNDYIQTFNELSYFTGLKNLGERAFDSCNNLSSVTLPEGLESIGDGAFSWCDNLSSVDLPSSLMTIGRYVFYNTGITSITIPENVSSVGESLFQNCEQLTTIQVADGNTVFDSRENSNAIIETATGKLIAGCQTTVIPSSVTTIGSYALHGLQNLTGITLPEGLQTLEEYAISECIHLQSVEFPSTLHTLGESCFASCDIRQVTIPATITTIVESPFESNHNLEKIVVAENNPNYDSRLGCNAIIEKATGKLVQGCNTTVIPSGVRSLSKNCFQGMNSLKKLVIPEGAISIGYYTFYPCEALEEISIPSTMQSIGHYAFYDCVSLKTVRCYVKEPITWHGSTSPFNCNRRTNQTNQNLIYDQATLYVPYGSLEKYKTAEVWKKFKTIVEMPAVQPGDANGDGTITISDAVVILSYILGDIPISFNSDAADVNGDGKLTVVDAVMVLDRISHSE